jgi:hypothetical protein
MVYLRHYFNCSTLVYVLFLRQDEEEVHHFGGILVQKVSNGLWNVFHIMAKRRKCNQHSADIFWIPCCYKLMGKFVHSGRLDHHRCSTLGCDAKRSIFSQGVTFVQNSSLAQNSDFPRR